MGHKESDQNKGEEEDNDQELIQSSTTPHTRHYLEVTKHKVIFLHKSVSTLKRLDL